MRNVWRLAWLQGLIALAAAAAFAHAAPSQAPPLEVLRPVLSACALLVLGSARGGGNAARVKRYTAAAGF
jgi:hypothetical protein